MLFLRGIRTNIKLGYAGEQKEYYVTSVEDRATDALKQIYMNIIGEWIRF